MPPTEEDESLLRDPSSDLKSFHASCEFLKYAIKNIKDLKKSSKDVSMEITIMI